MKTKATIELIYDSKPKSGKQYFQTVMGALQPHLTCELPVNGHKGKRFDFKVSKSRVIKPPVRIEVIQRQLCVVIQSKLNYGEDSTLPFKYNPEDV